MLINRGGTENVRLAENGNAGGNVEPRTGAECARRRFERPKERKRRAIYTSLEQGNHVTSSGGKARRRSPRRKGAEVDARVGRASERSPGGAGGCGGRRVEGGGHREETRWAR
jgi:hypothetical protein